MKSRPRTTSAAVFTPPMNGMALSAVSNVPPRNPFRRIAAPSVATASTAPTHGSDWESLLANRLCPYRTA
jgi:hypothetical protein